MGSASPEPPLQPHDIDFGFNPMSDLTGLHIKTHHGSVLDVLEAWTSSCTVRIDSQQGFSTWPWISRALDSFIYTRTSLTFVSCVSDRDGGKRRSCRVSQSGGRVLSTVPPSAIRFRSSISTSNLHGHQDSAGLAAGTSLRARSMLRHRQKSMRTHLAEYRWSRQLTTTPTF